MMVHVLDFLCCLFLREGLMYPRLASNLICNGGWHLQSAEIIGAWSDTQPHVGEV